MQRQFFHSGMLGDIIYSLPTVEALGGGDFVTGLPINLHRSIAPLLKVQACIGSLSHISENGLQPGFVNLSDFRNHPLLTRIHIAEATAEMQGIQNIHYRYGWLRVAEPVDKMLLYRVPQIMTGKDFAVISVTPRYRDRFHSWKGELQWLFKRVSHVYFIGHRTEFENTIFSRWRGGFFQQNKVTYLQTANLLEAAYVISWAKYFSGNQSVCLAIRQGLGMPYRFEQSPHHLDTEQDTENETILNPLTRRIHLASICIKKALFDGKTRRYDT